MKEDNPNPGKDGRSSFGISHDVASASGRESRNDQESQLDRGQMGMGSVIPQEMDMVSDFGQGDNHLGSGLPADDQSKPDGILDQGSPVMAVVSKPIGHSYSCVSNHNLNFATTSNVSVPSRFEILSHLLDDNDSCLNRAPFLKNPTPSHPLQQLSSPPAPLSPLNLSSKIQTIIASTCSPSSPPMGYTNLTAPCLLLACILFTSSDGPHLHLTPPRGSNREGLNEALKEQAAYTTFPTIGSLLPAVPNLLATLLRSLIYDSWIRLHRRGNPSSFFVSWG
ncbi:hypothetical protein NE237_009072 [Protea cynaroides]|uniref:Uncharacterized protein n=1 Tax=Protea cynaroides TaxID=273540 RepID=A0A9Q0KWS7_9MAGN|nr:hypothetical protein NE237_009072 [Protea cynaroides]